MENLKNSLDTNPSLPKSPTLVPPLHKERTTYLQNITNSPGANVFSETSMQAKWKHYPCISEGVTATIDDPISSKSPIGLVIDQSELPSKKYQVSHNDKENSPVLAEASSQPRQA